MNTGGPNDRRFSFVGRQPILDQRGRVATHDLLFRDSETATTARIENPLAAAVGVLISTFSELGPESLLGNLPGFINADPELAIALHIDALPESRIIFDLPATAVVDERLLERIDRLRAAGFDLCLDDYDYEDPRSELLPYVAYVKVDFSRHEAIRLRKITRELKKHSVQRIACRVETAKSRRIVEQQDWDLAQGYFFAKPERIARRSPLFRPGRLLDLVCQIDESTPIEEIAKGLRAVPHLTVNILSMANLLRTAPGERIESIQQALVMLGRKRLIRWLHLLLYPNDGPNGCADPLCQLSSTRSVIMESLARAQTNGIDPDRAGLVGMLSLTPALLDLCAKEVSQKLSLEYSIEQALTRRRGELGSMLKLVEQREDGNFGAVAEALDKLGLSFCDLERSKLEATIWSNGLSTVHTSATKHSATC